MSAADQLPLYQLSYRKEGEIALFFDPVRKKEVVLTREEYVRQCLVRFLLEEKKVPAGLFSLEKEILYNGLQRRYDLVVFNREGIPVLAAECKAPEIEINENVIRQLAVYNSALNAKFLLVTNGPDLFLFMRDAAGKFSPLQALPDFSAW